LRSYLSPMKGKRVLITGGNAGIGKATAIALAKMGAEVIITARSESKAKEAVAEIKKASGSEQVTYLLLDLSSQHEVRNAAQVFKTKYDRLDVLINNAGCYFSDLQLNTDGIEMQFATNHLGHFLFTNLLMPELKAADKARIINLSSIAHNSTRALDLNDINYQQQPYQGWKSYSRSKFCNILFTRELASRLEGTGITVNAVHPGGVRTEIAEKNANWYTKLGWILAKPFFITVEQGAATSIYLASSAQAANETGGYWVKSKRFHSNRPSQDPELAKSLWKKSEELVGQTF
jgi:NAD(P)-dependent dehydrogenase (short-subunit alcohol dehydrogenase family)